jgi:hypothetical protein
MEMVNRPIQSIVTNWCIKDTPTGSRMKCVGAKHVDVRSIKQYLKSQFP